MTRLVAVLLLAGVAAAWLRVAVTYVVWTHEVWEVFDLVAWLAGRCGCRVLRRHNRSCRGRRDHLANGGVVRPSPDLVRIGDGTPPLVVPTLTVAQIKPATLTAGRITVGTLPRMELDARGMRQYDASGTEVFRLDAPPYEPLRPFGILQSEPWRVRAWHRAVSSLHRLRWRLHGVVFPDCDGGDE